MMYKCPICGKSYEKWRSLHGHMLKDHPAEYRKVGCKLSGLGIAIEPAAKTKTAASTAKTKTAASTAKAKTAAPTEKAKIIPAGFRPLDRSDEEEAEAYAEGYRYYLDGAAYTSEEAREKGWI